MCNYFRMVVVPSVDNLESRCCAAYITHDKVGLITLPLDGNPHSSMALVAHPAGVSLS